MRKHDFVARTKFAPDGTTDGEGQRGHVGAENNLAGITAQRVRHGGACARNHRVRVATGRVGATGIGVIALQVIRNSVDHALRNLSSTGTIEKSRGLAVDSLRERRKLGANPIKIKRNSSFVLSG